MKKGTITINKAHNGIEIELTARPAERTRAALRSAGFRWHNVRKIWYAKQTPERLALAENIVQGTIPNTGTEAKNMITKENINKIRAEYGAKETGSGLYKGWTGNNYCNLYGQDLKKRILNELKKRGIKATARTGGGSYHTSYVFTVHVPEIWKRTENEYVKDYLDALPVVEDLDREEKHARSWHKYAKEHHHAETVKDDFRFLVVAIVNSFNSDHSNGMIDYFDRHFYDRYIWK